MDAGSDMALDSVLVEPRLVLDVDKDKTGHFQCALEESLASSEPFLLLQQRLPNALTEGETRP